MKQSPNRTQGLAYVAAVVYAAIIGLSFLFAKMTVNIAHPMDVLAHRFALSLLVVSVPVVLGWIRIKLTWRDLLRIIPLGLLSPVLFFAFQTFGLVSSNSSEAGIIQAMAPVFTLILASVFLKERTTTMQKLFLMLSVAGVIYIFLMKGTAMSLGNFKGIALLLLSTICFAGYGVLARPLTQKYKPMGNLDGWSYCLQHHICHSPYFNGNIIGLCQTTWGWFLSGLDRLPVYLINHGLYLTC